MQENAQEFDWKTQSKTVCNYTWLLHGKIIPSPDDAFSEFFYLEVSPVEGQSLQQKRKQKD